MSTISITGALVFSMLAVTTVAHADYLADVRATTWKNRYPSSASGSNNIIASQVEWGVLLSPDPTGMENTGLAWMPDPDSQGFLGKVFHDLSLTPSAGYSSHATTVGKLFYGNDAIAAGISTIYNYNALDWIGNAFLHADKTGVSPEVSDSRVVNHSWAGQSVSNAYNTRILRHVDWAVDQDELMQIVGVVAGDPIPLLLGSAFNVIAVSSTANQQAFNSPPLDLTYTCKHSLPFLVVPLGTASASAPVVASTVAALIKKAHNTPDLSRDPDENFRYTRNGKYLWNAERSEVIRAILAAGAKRTTHNQSFVNLNGYGAKPELLSPNGLDRRYGAGQLDVVNSYDILIAGEQNSAQTNTYTQGWIGQRGFDYDPKFGGAYDSNDKSSYYFKTTEKRAVLHASLTWNAKVLLTKVPLQERIQLEDLDLFLHDISSTPALIGSSASQGDNSEHLWVSLEPNRIYELSVTLGFPNNSVPVDYALAWRVEPDQDGDKVPDSDDNCLAIRNSDQFDADDDGFGNQCDPDLNNDLLVDSADLLAMKHSYGLPDIKADLDGNGYVTASDLSILKKYVGSSPGPSGLRQQ